MSDTKRGIEDTIVRALGDLALGVSDWRLVRTGIAGNERYFVGDRLEQARAVDTGEYRLTVYVDAAGAGGKVRGEATVTIRPTDSEAEIDARVARAAHAASKSRNPWFELPGPAAPAVAIPESGFAAGDPGVHLAACMSALYSGSGPERPESRINSLELFLRREATGFLNSRGQRIDSVAWKGYTEFVIESAGVELFDDLAFSEPDARRLASAIGARLDQVRDRAIARPMPDLNGLPVLLVGKEAEALFGWFFDNAQVQAIHSRASSFSAGINVQAPDGKGVPLEPLDLRAEAFLQGLPQSAAFDPDGFPLSPVDIIRQGILETLTGSVRHADWLGVPRTGAFPLFSVSPGRTGIEAFRAQPCLEPVMFSDFQTDPVSGAFGGEIRLAYWNDGVSRIPVSGGSITGTVGESRLTMLRSAERALGERSLCPMGLLLRNVSVTPAA